MPRLFFTICEGPVNRTRIYWQPVNQNSKTRTGRRSRKGHVYIHGAKPLVKPLTRVCNSAVTPLFLSFLLLIQAYYKFQHSVKLLSYCIFSILSFCGHLNCLFIILITLSLFYNPTTIKAPIVTDTYSLYYGDVLIGLGNVDKHVSSKCRPWSKCPTD